MEPELLSEQLTADESENLEALKILGDEGVPTILYGAGDYATSILNFLNKRDLNNIKAICLDPAFVTEPEWKGLPVYSTDEISRQFDRFNILIGISDFVVARKRLKDLPGVDRVLFLDSVTFFHLISRDYVSKNIDSFSRTYQSLADDLSRKIMVAYLNAKLSGLPRELYDLHTNDQYFPAGVLDFSDEEVFVDAGAYDGDSVHKFSEAVSGQYQAIYAFEPDQDNYEQLTASTRNMKSISTENKGLWDTSTQLKFSVDTVAGVKSSIQSDGESTIDVESLDAYLGGSAVVTYLKMDIEGAELQALKGAEQILRNNKPKLAIAAYHKPDDLFVLTQYLHSIVPEYKLYLRHHMPISQELVLYAKV